MVLIGQNDYCRGHSVAARHAVAHAKLPRVTLQVGLVGVGYQGRQLDELVPDLLSRRVSRLVDVRLTPVSRKPGFSKRALCRALAEVGVAYEHLPELGNPRWNRAGFGGDHRQVQQARQHYAARLASPGAQSALDRVARSAADAVVALLCFEAEEHRCHRSLVLHEARGRLARAVTA